MTHCSMVCAALMMGHSRMLLALVFCHSATRMTPSMRVPTSVSVAPPDASAELGNLSEKDNTGWKLRYTAPDTPVPAASNTEAPGSPGTVNGSEPGTARLEK